MWTIVRCAIDYISKPLYMTINQFIGNKIREVRKNKGISQEKLALDASIDRTYICDIENGNRNISLEIIEKISKALNIKISLLFQDYNA